MLLTQKVLMHATHILGVEATAVNKRETVLIIQGLHISEEWHKIYTHKCNILKGHQSYREKQNKLRDTWCVHDRGGGLCVFSLLSLLWNIIYKQRLEEREHQIRQIYGIMETCLSAELGNLEQNWETGRETSIFLPEFILLVEDDIKIRTILLLPLILLPIPILLITTMANITWTTDYVSLIVPWIS